MDFGQCKRIQFASEIAEYSRLLAHNEQIAVNLRLVFDAIQSGQRACSGRRSWATSTIILPLRRFRDSVKASLSATLRPSGSTDAECTVVFFYTDPFFHVFPARWSLIGGLASQLTWKPK